jgi:hypothetical protein
MVKKAIVALACVLIASLAFAQTTTNHTRHYRTRTAIISVEGVTVTAPIIASEGGSVASYQPAGTLVIARTVRIQSGLICPDAGLSTISSDER